MSEQPTETEQSADSSSWKVLVVDDDQDMHAITRLALKGFRIEAQPLQFLHAYSASEAAAMLAENPDIAVVLLDVVMESNQAGLELVEHIRGNLGNERMRIIIRTGQPGEAPESSVLEDYQVDDYRLKTELTQSKLHSILMASIRTYEAMERGEAYRQTLERKIQERTARIQQQKETLEALNNIKNKLFSILSHDLRSPLVVLRSLVDVAERRLMSADNVAEVLDDVRTHLDYALPMLDQLLAWANSQLEGFRVRPEAFEPEGWLTETIALLQPAAERKQLQLYLAAAPVVRVYADPSLASLVLRNLIQNAIKFTPASGEICVSARQAADRLEVEVRDTGVGMSPQDLAKVKSSVFISRRGTNGEPGTGLGLVLCREFAQLNGGEFWIRSELGQGSTFGFSLPLAEG